MKQRNGTPCELEDIWQTWYLVYRRHYFKTALENAHNLKKQFYHYQETNGVQVLIKKHYIITIIHDLITCVNLNIFANLKLTVPNST